MGAGLLCNKGGLGSYLSVVLGLLDCIPIGLHPNTPLQTDTRPIPWMCFLCFMHGDALVKTLAVCSGSQQLLKHTTLSCTKLHTQCQHIVMCLDFLWNVGLFAMAMDPLLSPYIWVGISGFCNLSSVCKLQSQHALCEALDIAMYSASMEDCAWGYLLLRTPHYCSATCNEYISGSGFVLVHIYIFQILLLSADMIYLPHSQ